MIPGPAFKFVSDASLTKLVGGAVSQTVRTVSPTDPGFVVQPAAPASVPVEQQQFEIPFARDVADVVNGTVNGAANGAATPMSAPLPESAIPAPSRQRTLGGVPMTWLAGAAGLVIGFLVARAIARR